MQRFEPQEIIVERGSENTPIFRNLKKALPHVPVRFVDDAASKAASTDAPSSDFGDAKKRLYLSKHKGEF
ncbi:MAG: hypothetical protein ACREO5_08205, partial [Candidatus Binatia bacterium]